MSENENTPERSRLDRVLDGAAGVTGKSIFGMGYVCGRIAPKVRRAARSIADTRFGSFIGTHFSEGFGRGEERCLQKEAEAEARRMLAAGGEAAREAATMFLADVYRFLGLDTDGKRAAKATS